MLNVILTKQRDQMREFLGQMTTAALDWHNDVRGVYVWLETSFHFEGNGWDGAIEIALEDNRRWGYRITSYEMQFAQSQRGKEGLRESIRNQFLRDLNKAKSQ